MAVKGRQIGKVKPAMKCCHVGDLRVATQREVQVINVKMNQVEILFFIEDLVEHHNMMGQLVHTVRIQSQSFLTTRSQTSSRKRVAASEQSHGVTKTD